MDMSARCTSFPEVQESPIDEDAKKAVEQSKLGELLRAYPEADRHLIETNEGMDIIACGEFKDEYIAILQAGLLAMERRFGKEAIARAISGVKIYIADASITGGGQALPRVNAVILNDAYMGISIDKMEEIASDAGLYRKGDQSKFFGGEADASEIGFVHEMGHIVEYRAHGDMGVGFRSLKSEESPTWYGQRAPHEDYAESWMFTVYGHPISADREAILARDIKSAGQ
jgi:hypothetical protein